MNVCARPSPNTLTNATRVEFPSNGDPKSFAVRYCLLTFLPLSQYCGNFERES